jgi:hypothetical protein
MDSALRLGIELLTVASSGVALLQARVQFRRAVRLRGPAMAITSLIGAPLASLGLVLLFTRGGFVVAGIIAIALTLMASVLAFGDRRRWRVRKDYRLGLIALACDLASSALMAAAMLTR